MEMRYIPGVVTLKQDFELCNGCRMCTIVCPHGVWAFEDKKAHIKEIDACMECGACALNCESEAISVEPGVGCAESVICGLLRGTEPTCDCS
jgi:NAD-dependent dihydropyrimidine dehydrogenase PreA subunit